MIRLMLGEPDRFPALAATFCEVAVRWTGEAMADLLRRQCKRGLIRLEDPDGAAGMLPGMMAMEPQHVVLLGQRPAPSPGK